jgi:hypothetical protein
MARRKADATPDAPATVAKPSKPRAKKARANSRQSAKPSTSIAQAPKRGNTASTVELEHVDNPSEQQPNSGGKRKAPPVGKPFEPGKSGNPGGRPKQIAEVRDLAREHTPDAIRILAKWMKQDDNPSAAVAAAREMLDRGWGKAAQALTGENGEGSGKIVIEFAQ